MATAGAVFGSAAAANPKPWDWNVTKGVTDSSIRVYHLHMLGFYVCVVIGILVFGTMFVAMFRFRKSRGAVAEKWSHNTKLEAVWTIIPVLILIGLAWPASSLLASMADTSGSQMTVKVTGYQWKWRYDYVDYKGQAIDKVGFMSKLDALSNRTRQLDSGLDPDKVQVDGYNTYLLNVDKPLVLPVGVKIRFIITGGDVIHSWWVPALGWKVDAIPGIVNATWAKIEKPGVYRGQCAELCGQDHGFMPIVVKAVPQAEFARWLAAQAAANPLDQAARTAQAEGRSLKSDSPQQSQQGRGI